MSLRGSAFSGEAREIRACARVPAVVRAPERPRYGPVRADSADFSPRRADSGPFADAGPEGTENHQIAVRRRTETLVRDSVRVAPPTSRC